MLPTSADKKDAVEQTRKSTSYFLGSFIFLPLCIPVISTSAPRSTRGKESGTKRRRCRIKRAAATACREKAYILALRVMSGRLVRPSMSLSPAGVSDYSFRKRSSPVRVLDKNLSQIRAARPCPIPRRMRDQDSSLENVGH